MALRIGSGPLRLGRGGGLQIKTSSGLSDPRTITGLKQWYKADAGALDASDVAITVDGTAVKTWQDQSGNADHATQLTALNRPTWKASIQNSKPVVRFGGSHLLETGGASGAQPVTIFIVGKGSLSDANFQNMYGTGASGVYKNNTTANRLMIYGGTVVADTTGPSIVSQFRVICAQMNGASSFGRVDGAQVVAGNVGVGSFVSAVIGRSGAGGQFFTGDIGELLVYTGAISGANITLIEGYLRTRWGTA